MILHFSDIKKSPVSTSASAYLQPEIWTWKSENRPKVDQCCVRKQPWNSPQRGTLTLQILCRLNKTWYNMITQCFGGGVWKNHVMLGYSQDCCPTPTILFVWSHLLCNILICEWFQFPHQNCCQESKNRILYGEYQLYYVWQSKRSARLHAAMLHGLIKSEGRIRVREFKTLCPSGHLLE